MKYFCCDERRLQAVKDAGVLNALAWVEVSDSEAPTGALRQRTLFLRLLHPAPGLGPLEVRIDGGERIATVAVEWVAPATALPAGESPALLSGQTDLATLAVVRTASRGDFSTYTLRLVSGVGSDEPPAGFDPLLASVEFSFKVECPSDFDCAPVGECPPDPVDVPAIDYLAKDYGSLRRLILDRMSLLAPGWQERSPADLGVALVELLAYVGDQLSYQQDAVATEAYLGTSRSRISLRRHARLVDYVVQEGANARTWVQLTVAGSAVPVPAGTPLLTRTPDLPGRVDPGSAEHRAALAAGAETFETVEDALLYAKHARFDFWTAGDAGCCLPRGATSATLLGHHPRLKAGDVLVFMEVNSPTTGRAEDADPAKRCAARLTSVVSGQDPSGGLFLEPPTATAVKVTELTWDAADALRFPLCLGAENRPGLVVSEARGNIVLADHGRTVRDEPIGTVPEPWLQYASRAAGAACSTVAPAPVPVRFRPTLSTGPLTHARPAPLTLVADGPVTPALLADLTALTVTPAVHDWLVGRGVTFTAGTPVARGGDGAWSVSDGDTVAVLWLDSGRLRLFARPPAATSTVGRGGGESAQPVVRLDGTFAGVTDHWLPQSDLLESGSAAVEFVVEMDDAGIAHVRFGDGKHGRRPDTGTVFVASYRVGNGAAGNIGAEAIAHVVTIDARLTTASNLVAAVGGTEPEAADAIRRDAPEAFLVQERAVTADDYAEVTTRDPRVQRAAATFRWTGSWHTVFVTADRAGGLAVDEPFGTSLRGFLERYRMAGYDLDVDGPRPIALDIALQVCAKPEHFRAHVKAALLAVLSSGTLPDGRLGLFHPDRFTLGQPVYLSAIVAATQAVEGVDSVTPLRFQRQREPATSALDSGVLTMGRLEVARLDNDPNFAEHGLLTLAMGGGK